jgi:circadian clock protein KaiC
MKSPRDEPAFSKATTGIAGFDQITRGGLPQGRMTLLLDGPECGKTLFALQRFKAYRE